MTITDHRPAAKTAARDTEAEDRAAALKIMRADAVEYVTALFDWLGEGQYARSAAAHAFLEATEKRFHEVLAGIIEAAEESHFSYEYLCTEENGCRCLNCRYPAEDPDEDMRSASTRLMDNVRAKAAREAAEARP